MTVEEIDKRTGELFEEWKNLQPLKPEDEERFAGKIRLEWNYNSNHIAGNSLTYNETELLLVHGRAAGGHRMRDYEEMKAHNAAINKVVELAKGKKRGLTETDIKDLNKTILREPFMSPAETADGRKTRKEIVPGQYKKQQNNVKTATGEVVKFAKPREVPAKMAELMEWFNKNIGSARSIASFLAELNCRFVSIHPFDDGNGRVARLWVNYALLRLGYPPLVVRGEKKDNYFAALQKADTGDMDALAALIGESLVFWLETGIKAAKGEGIGDISDIDKEAELFIERQNIKDLLPISREVAEKLYKDCFSEAFELFKNKFQLFDELFQSTERVFSGFGKSLPESPDVGRQIESSIGGWTWGNANSEIIDWQIIYKTYKGELRDSVMGDRFGMRATLQIRMELYRYTATILSSNDGIFQGLSVSAQTEKKYDEPWTEAEIKDFVAQGKRGFLEALKKATGEEAE